MLKLEYLLDRPELTRQILAIWSHDDDDDILLSDYRISSNAVYPFHAGNEIRILRFAPLQEKSEDQLIAELDFLRYLEQNDYPALRIVPSVNGRDYEKIDTEFGMYLACVFARVPGESLDKVGMKKNLMQKYGATLGNLHQQSSMYVNENCPRQSYSDIFSWMTTFLSQIDGQEIALSEANFLEKLMNTLPKTAQIYGLIHYDFEPDNVFWDRRSATFHVIDFDDSMYHFFAMDLAKVFDELEKNMSKSTFETARALFLKGYRSVFPISDESLELLPLFSRFSSLYEYCRLLYALDSTALPQPEWMQNLRGHLLDLLAESSLHFGKPLFGMTARVEPIEKVPELRLLSSSHCVFPVPDILRTAKYYEDYLRFSSVFYTELKEPHICLYRDDIEIILTQAKSDRVFPNRELYGYGYDAYFITSEQDLLQTEFSFAGVKIVRELSKTDYQNREFVFEDIDGRWIGVGIKELDPL